MKKNVLFYVVSKLEELLKGRKNKVFGDTKLQDREIENLIRETTNVKKN